MNHSIIIYILGWVLKFEAIFLLLPCIVALIYGEASGFAFLIIAFICACIGLVFSSKKPSDMSFYAKEGFITVSLSWILLSIMGSLPFVLSGEIPNFTNALFETVSGFTTTGASVLSNVEALSKCCNLWRCFTQWIGGMGVLVFILAILPLVGAGNNIYLMKAESPGPTVSKLVPHVRSSAMILYSIYLTLSLAQFIFLLLGKMPVFDALCTTFATAGTGGFSIKNNSIVDYSPYLQNVITVFMFLFGANFVFYYLLLCRKIKAAFKLEEMRGYFIIVLLAVFGITLDIRGDEYSSFLESFHHAVFQVCSIITTTGYSSADFNIWPGFSIMVLIILMFVGACAGSTSGGFKISRLLILFKTVKKELICITHPRSVKKIKVDDRLIEHGVIRSANVFMIVYILVLGISLLLLSLNEYNFSITFTAALATLNNVGPGLDVIGPMGNYEFFSPLSKYILMFNMLAGRLELFPLLVLFAPATWRK